MRTRLLVAAALAVLVTSSTCLAAIRWHDTYEEALEAAQETGRPMVVVVVRKGAKNVLALKKLFVKRQTAWAGRVFVFCYEEVEIVNNTVSSRLFAKFRFQGQLRLPLFFFAGPDEKLLGQTMDKTPSNLGDMLKIAYHKHGPVADPKKLKAALARLKAADALYEKGKHGPAARLYGEVVAMKFKAPPVEAARVKLAELEKAANQQLDDARSDIEEKAYADAIDKLAELDRGFSSLQAGRAARSELARLRKLPAAQKAFAELDQRARERETQPGTPAAVALDDADWKLDGFTDDELDALDAMAGGAQPTRPPAGAAADVSKKCRRLLGLARNWIANKQPDKARRYLQQILDEHPDTLYADQAKAILEGLQ